MKQEYIQIILTAAAVAVALFFIGKRIYRAMSSDHSGQECSKCGTEKLND